MKYLLQILFLLFTWFNLSATPPFSKVALPNYAVSFHKTENQNLESEVKIGISNFARSGISENSFPEKSVLWKSYVLENRAREAKFKGVQGAGNIFELSAFKNLTARIPSGSKLTNLKKSEFLAHGYKVKPTSGGLKTQIDDIIANGDVLGAKTESIVDDIMSGNGYTKMDGKYRRNNGYDGVYIKGTIGNPTEIVIIESKQFKYANGAADDVVEHGGVTLNPNYEPTGLPAQMSDGWIQYVQNKIRTESNLITDPILKQNRIDFANMIRDFDDKITKYVTAVDKTQAEINFLKLGTY